MKKHVFGIILLLAGLACIGLSLYIKERVAQGKLLVSGAQNRLDQGNSLLSIAPGGGQVGGMFSHSAQGKIDEGSSQIKYYEEMSNWLIACGLVSTVLGCTVIFFTKRK